MMEKRRLLQYGFSISFALSTFYYLFLLDLGLKKSIFFHNNKKLEKPKAENSIIHFAVNSAFYYKTSKLYSPNSMIVLINAEKAIEFKNMTFQCHSKNKSSTLITDSQLRVAEPGPFCKWIMYILNCTTVENPDYFGISTFNSKNAVVIKFEYPVEKTYPVVMCYPPMVYESRWQQTIFATEIYRHFGADLQIQYVNSAMSKVLEILKIYELKKWIVIRHFVYFDFSPSIIKSLGYHPMLELDSRNQPLAYTDRIMKYRESSNFVIAADLDDVLFPTQKTYFAEFSHWAKLNPNSVAFLYFRKPADLNAAKDFEMFSFSDSIKSIKVYNDRPFTGKSVYQTQNAEAVWIHWPYFQNETTATIPVENGTIYHMFITDEEILERNFSGIPLKDLSKMEAKQKASFLDMPSFASNDIYAKAIFQCYGNLAEQNHQNYNKPKTCLTPLACPKPKKVNGFSCHVAKRKFTSTNLSDKVVFHVFDSSFTWEQSKNGCNIFSVE